eukprot:gnl/Spiro4/9656_TR5124_c0_g1_i1.p1 gnl/Spiro4/9656_TR5124_c0_g1~~gnl/Spiro4/9656_TR5124_c0_g1_i1.p1  ORF type:complete len:2413 (+),score=551.86 gnl/Spiro4/9656_TR5124_c0_g1_i1:148-7386(+)
MSVPSGPRVQSENDTLTTFLNQLRSRSEDDRQKAARNLRLYVEKESRDISAESFSELMKTLCIRLHDIVNSNEAHEKMGGIMVMDQLIDLDWDIAMKITYFGANYLRMIIVQPNDSTTLAMAAATLGHLVRVGGSLTASLVEAELQRALQRLQTLPAEKTETLRRTAAVLVLKELARNAPTLFTMHMPKFLDHVWSALQDPKSAIRDGAFEALQCAIKIISKREMQAQPNWYSSLFENALARLRSSPPQKTEAVLAALLVLGELLSDANEWLRTRLEPPPPSQPRQLRTSVGTPTSQTQTPISYDEFCDAILRYRDSREKMIKKTVLSLIPSLALLHPATFGASRHLEPSLHHILSVIKKDTECSGFLALGQIAKAIGTRVQPHLGEILARIKEVLSTSKRSSRASAANGTTSTNHDEAVTCLSMLVAAMGGSSDVVVIDTALLEQLFSCGLTVAMIEALRSFSQHLPNLVPEIQRRLLDLISLLLARVPYIAPGMPLASRRPTYAVVSSETHDSAQIVLALTTLRTFDFSSFVDWSPADFLASVVVHFLDDPNPLVRKEAVLACGQVPWVEGQEQLRARITLLVAEVLEKLLITGVSDTDMDIRLTVMQCLDARFDQHLAQAENLRSLFLALNDEAYEIRESALVVVGRLTERNPAYIMPLLRKYLIQLLTELEFSGDSRNKEESARLLGSLMRVCHRLISPYITPILKALLDRLNENNLGVSAAILEALGELARVGGAAILPSMEDILRPIIATLQDQSPGSKREVALRTLTHVIQSSGHVIKPYYDHPQLLNIILSVLGSEQTWTVRREAIRVLGILGAVDPHTHKMKLVEHSGRDLAPDTTPSAPGNSEPVAQTSSEEHYPVVATAVLLSILKDNTLRDHHRVLNALLHICHSLGLKCVQFLPQLMPPLLNVLSTCEPGLRQEVLAHLSDLVGLVKQHIRPYLTEIFALIRTHWDVQGPTQTRLITLIEQISLALGDEFKLYLPSLIYQVLSLMHFDRRKCRETTIKVLSALEKFGPNLEEYLHLATPAIVRLFEQVDMPLDVRRVAIETFGRLCRSLNFTEFASRIVHSLGRVLDGQPELRLAATDALCALAAQVGPDFCIFVPMLNKIISKHKIAHPSYEVLVSHLLKNQVTLAPEALPLLPPYPNSSSVGGRGADGGESSTSAAASGSSPDSERTWKHPLTDEAVKALAKTWETEHYYSNEDWFEWMRRLSIELLHHSPAPALRGCYPLAQVYPKLARDLFNSAFSSCWTDLPDTYQDKFCHSLVTAFECQSLPPEIIQTLLNLAEFMERDEKPFKEPDPARLGPLADKCHAYAKALHYFEMEFVKAPTKIRNIESLISVNNQLYQPDAAAGILAYVKKAYNMEPIEAWYEKQQNWEGALAVYDRKLTVDPSNIDLQVNRMHCLHELGEYERLDRLAGEFWLRSDESDRRQMSTYAAEAAWNLNNWADMAKYVELIPESSNTSPEGPINKAFFRAILAIHSNNFVEGERWIDSTRQLVEKGLTALVGESYTRAYKVVVKVQQISELEEVIAYKKNIGNAEYCAMISRMWKSRLDGCQRHADVWQRGLAVRSLVIPRIQDQDTWLKFVSLCLKSNRFSLARRTLHSLFGFDPTASGEHCAFGPNIYPKLSFTFFQYLWAVGEDRSGVLHQLNAFAQHVQAVPSFCARVHRAIGTFELELLEQSPAANADERTRRTRTVLNAFKCATENDNTSYKAWHAWASANFEEVALKLDEKRLRPELFGFVTAAIQGFLRSISLRVDNLQDVLRLLTLWFRYGHNEEIARLLSEGFESICIDTWLNVIPQLIARIHTPQQVVRKMIHDLLLKVGEQHPQALIYPLMVAAKSAAEVRKAAALSLMDRLRKHCPNLIEESLMVSRELIRVAILWHELWHEGLEEASRFYFGEQPHNVEAMFQALGPLHTMMATGAETSRELSFQHSFGRDLQDAYEWCERYRKSKCDNDLNQAWDLYYHTFRRISKQLLQMTTLELQYVSPKLLNARDLELAVPGTYQANVPVIRIKDFAPTLKVIVSKQRPRRLVINGSNGQEFAFLLKGHEDLRQDERVMQLFGLVNTLLANDREAAKRHLAIQRYSVIPLAPNSGLIGWVPHCDTLHSLIRDYRETRRILLNIEHRLMVQMAPDFEGLTLIQKVEVFQFALDSTKGEDLQKVLWLKSRNSEMWLDRRTNYTRSLAVMSMVGYILGLGDRHPSNLMLQRFSGKVIHIDFGDCFEVAMKREKFPEKIPFRLTRMLSNAMEVSGIEGTFRSTCENVMRVLRNNKDSLMAVLEAFVYDPLINWRLWSTPEAKPTTTATTSTTATKSSKSDLLPNEADDQPRRTRTFSRERDDATTTGEEVQNVRALEVITRVSNKLSGKDFTDESLNVEKQVDKLIQQATSHECLCQLYIGWCPFW